jgi:hypothetical protein
MPYSANLIATGDSRALIVEDAFFAAHPELADAAFEVHVIGPGTMLFHAISDDVERNDPPDVDADAGR